MIHVAQPREEKTTNEGGRDVEFSVENAMKAFIVLFSVAVVLFAILKSDPEDSKGELQNTRLKELEPIDESELER